MSDALPIFDRIISENSDNRAEALQVLKSIKQEDDGTLYEKVQEIIKKME